MISHTLESMLTITFIIIQRTNFFSASKIADNISVNFGMYRNGFSHLGKVGADMFLQNGNCKLLKKSSKPGLNKGGVGQSMKAITFVIN